MLTEGQATPWVTFHVPEHLQVGALKPGCAPSSLRVTVSHLGVPTPGKEDSRGYTEGLSREEALCSLGGHRSPHGGAPRVTEEGLWDLPLMARSLTHNTNQSGRGFPPCWGERDQSVPWVGTSALGPVGRPVPWVGVRWVGVPWLICRVWSKHSGSEDPQGWSVKAGPPESLGGSPAHVPPVTWLQGDP